LPNPVAARSGQHVAISLRRAFGHVVQLDHRHPINKVTLIVLACSSSKTVTGIALIAPTMPTTRLRPENTMSVY
jgi:hypothetical protein